MQSRLVTLYTAPALRESGMVWYLVDRRAVEVHGRRVYTAFGLWELWILALFMCWRFSLGEWISRMEFRVPFMGLAVKWSDCLMLGLRMSMDGLVCFGVYPLLVGRASRPCKCCLHSLVRSACPDGAISFNEQLVRLFHSSALSGLAMGVFSPT